MDNRIIRLYVRRFEGQQPENHDVALGFHNQRKQAVHQALEDTSLWKVESWGKTDDDEDIREEVELFLRIGKQAMNDPNVQAVVVPALAFLGGLLTKAS